MLRRYLFLGVFALSGGTLCLSVAHASVTKPRTDALSVTDAARLAVEYWDIIVEGRVISYDLTSVATPAGPQLWCSSMTIAVDRNITGGSGRVLRAITGGFPKGEKPPANGVFMISSAQIPLPDVGSHGLFLLYRAGSQEKWVGNTSAIVFVSTHGAWVPKAEMAEIYSPGGWRTKCLYSEFIAELEGVIRSRDFEALAKRAMFIARVRLGPTANKTVSSNDSLTSVRYPMEVEAVYRGNLSRAASVLFMKSTLASNHAEVDYMLAKRLMQKLQANEEAEVLVFGEVRGASDIVLLPGGLMTMSNESMVEMGHIHAFGDSATVLRGALEDLEVHLR